MKTKKITKFTAGILLFSMILLMLPLGAINSFAVTYTTSSSNAKGSAHTDSPALATVLDKIFSGDIDIYLSSTGKEVSMPLGYRMLDYDDSNSQYKITSKTTGSVYKAYECQAYANAVYNKLFNEWVGSGTAFSHSEIVIGGGKNTVSYSLFTNAGVRSGAYIRTTNYSSGAYNGNAGHAMIILSYNSSNITYLEGNGDGNGLVRIASMTWDEFNTKQLKGRSRYTCHIVQPKGSYYDSLYPSNSIDIKDKIINVAKSQIASYGSDNNKFTKWFYGKETTAAWCAIFVSWCANEAGVLNSAIPKKDNCNSMMQWFKDRSVFYSVDSGYSPQKGDIVFFDTKGTGANHVELVSASGYITESGKTKVKCIGGNTSNSNFSGSDYVSEKNRYIYESSAKVIGYAHPSYDGKYTINTGSNPDSYPVLDRDLVYKSGVAVKTGDDVKWLQCILLHLGYSIAIDGSYGPSSKSIVEKFQSAYGLAVDGQVGPATRAKLKEVWSSKGHTWGSATVTKNATCTATGVKTYKCNYCEATKTETISTVAHNYGSWQYADGSNHKRICSSCNTAYQTASHTWNSGVITKNATCTASGVKTYTCTGCNAAKTETIPATGHNYGSWKNSTLSNHIRYCSNCGVGQQGTHAWNSGTITKSATCTASGVKTYTCTVCSTTKTETISKIPHVYGDWKYEDSGCHKRVCACGDYNLMSHSWDDGVITKELTCAESGIRTYTCSVCSGKYNEYFNGIKAHSWDSGKVTKNPTCTESGVKTYTCSVCLTTKTETIKTKAHSWNDGEITKNPNCTEAGLKTYTCTVCNSTKEEKLPAIATAHNFGSWENSDSTNHKRICSYCSAYQTSGHTWDKGKITKDPTVEHEGEMTYTCTVCEGTKTEKIEKLTPTEPPIEDEPIVDPSAPTVTVESTNGFAGGTVDITVSIKNNPGIWSMAVDMPIDTDIFEFVSADVSDSVFDSIASSAYDKSTNSYKFNGYYSDYFNDITENGAVFVITLKIKDDVECGEYELAIKLLENQIVNSNEENVKFYSINGSVKVQDYMVGDVNGDGYVTNADILRIFRYIYNSELYPLEFIESGDVNGDGYVTNADVLRIFRYIYNFELYPLS